MKWEKDEAEVVKLIPCPNCNKKLMLLPRNYPLYDTQCTGCSFRAQIKTVNSKPKSVFFGAGWQIINKVLKSGFLSPMLIVNFKWTEKKWKHQEIRFYPFVPKANLCKYTLSKTARRANYQIFHYKDMNKIPYFILYAKKK